MAGEAVLPIATLRANLQFSSLMAAARQTDSQTAQKLARLQAHQKAESSRRKETELAEKERAKQETWNKVLDNHEKQVEAATLPKESKHAAVAPPVGKTLQPVSDVFLSS